MIFSSAIPALVAYPLRTLLAPIDPTLRGYRTDPVAPISISWIVLLCVAVSAGSLLVVLGHAVGLHNPPYAWAVFWPGVILMLLPIIRIADVKVARSERILLLILVAEAILLYKALYSPTSFVEFDEMLHWMSFDDILYRHKLFLENSLLPIAPFYPALEIVTTALANLAGVTVFPAGMLVLIVIRAMVIVGLFLFFEKLSGSARLGAIAAIVYMCSATFPIFESGFAYESLGLPLCVLIGLAELQINRTTAYSVRALVLPGMLLATLAVTHHVSAFWMAGYLIVLMVIEAFRRKERSGRRMRHLLLVGVVSLGVVFPLVWMNTKGNPLVNYLGPVIESALNSFYEKISGKSSPRQMFVAENGLAQPIGIQLTGMAGTLLVAVGLATGFFRSLCLSIGTHVAGWSRFLWVLRREWLDSRIILLTLAAFGFPISVALRVSTTGWEIGHRMNTFVFIGVAFVVAISVVHFWQARPTRWNRIGVNTALVIMVLGNVMLGSGYLAIHAPYMVGADPGSIEPMGIGVAEWTKDWIGPGQRFSADRVNKTLLATYGDQNIISGMQHVDISRTIFSKQITGDALYPIRYGKIDFLLLDLRLTTARAVLGEYYEHGEHSGGYPPLPSFLLKFDRETNAGRIYDNGFIVIYDVRRLHE
jgi:hypothetical protein